MSSAVLILKLSIVKMLVQSYQVIYKSIFCRERSLIFNKRKEEMMTTLIIFIGFFIYLILYLTYGRKLERDVVKVSNEQPTPSHRLYDGVDYIPARKEVLLGHHFASIAGAAPIIGPALAICWGWLPALLWVWLGNIFIGAVHDLPPISSASGRVMHFTGSSFFF
jgi:hypothetical protein